MDRARRVRAEWGWRGVLFGALDLLGYRRLELLERCLGSGAAPVPAEHAAGFAQLESSQVPELLELRPDLDEGIVRSRFARGHLCFGIRFSGRLVHASWASAEALPLPFLRAELPLRAGEIGLYDAYTDPRMRRRGLQESRLLLAFELLASRGYRRVIGAVLPENRQAVAVLRTVGFVQCGTVRCAGIGAWGRLTISRAEPPPGVHGSIVETLTSGDRPTDWARWDARRRSPARRVRTTGAAAVELLRQRLRLRHSIGRQRELQDRRARWIVTHAYRRVPHYRESMRARGLRPSDFGCAADLRKLPLLDPDELRADPERFVAEGVDIRELSVSATSGTSGKPRGLVVRSERALLDSLVKGERDRALLVGLASESYPASLLAELAGPSAAGRLLDRLLDPRGAHRRVSIFALNTSVGGEKVKWERRTMLPLRSARHRELPAAAPLEQAITTFNELRPRIAFSFGSYAERFLRFVAAEAPTVALPRVWAYVGDGLSAEGHRTARALGVRLSSTYSAVETGRIGWQCEVGQGHHLNTDTCAVRVVDSEGEELAPGERGRLVVSNLINEAMVILNYAIGDTGRLASEPCPCGRAAPLLAELSGRVSDQLRLADGRELPALVVDALFRWQLRQAHFAQIEQPASGHLRFRVIPCGGADREAIRAEIAARATEVMPGTLVEVSFASSPAERGLGKAPLVLRDSDPAEAPAPPGRPR